MISQSLISGLRHHHRTLLLILMMVLDSSAHVGTCTRTLHMQGHPIRFPFPVFHAVILRLISSADLIWLSWCHWLLNSQTVSRAPVFACARILSPPRSRPLSLHPVSHQYPIHSRLSFYFTALVFVVRLSMSRCNSDQRQKTGDLERWCFLDLRFFASLLLPSMRYLSFSGIPFS